jgi:hypothetical protein
MLLAGTGQETSRGWQGCRMPRGPLPPACSGDPPSTIHQQNTACKSSQLHTFTWDGILAGGAYTGFTRTHSTLHLFCMEALMHRGPGNNIMYLTGYQVYTQPLCNSLEYKVIVFAEDRSSGRSTACPFCRGRCVTGQGGGGGGHAQHNYAIYLAHAPHCKTKKGNCVVGPTLGKSFISRQGHRSVGTGMSPPIPTPMCTEVPAKKTNFDRDVFLSWSVSRGCGRVR